MVGNLSHEEKTFVQSGLPMTTEAFEQVISVESSYRYELIAGRVYDMTGSTPEHSVLTGNMYLLFRQQIGQNGPCRVHQDQYVEIPQHPPVVPDVVLTCDLADWDKDKRRKPFRIQSPLIVAEILSPKTEKYDRGEKFLRYQCCPSLQVYILISQKEQCVEVYQRATGWQAKQFTTGIITLDQLDLEFPLTSIYEGIF